MGAMEPATASDLVGATEPEIVDPAIRVSGLTKRFGETEVIRGIDFELPPAAILGIIGASGSGKTTILRMLLGVVRPTAGDLSVLGRRPDQLDRHDRDQIGYVPQLFALTPELTVAQNLDFAAALYGMGWRGRGERIRDVLDLVELWPARSRPAGRLSGGMQRRLQLAAALVHSPRLIFLDEPTAGIDPLLRAKFWEHFRRLRDSGHTLVVTTQYITESEHCDRIVALRDGRIADQGSPLEVRRRVLGGDIVHVAGPDLGDRAIRTIESVDGVRGARQIEGGRVEVVVDDAGRAVPRLIEALRAAEIPVAAVEEQHPSFDEVFVRLMAAEGSDRG
jgi:ABC-2 type transport system ATP-binding protein